MQVRTPARHPASRVGSQDRGSGRPGRDGWLSHDAQQVGFGGPLPATHTGAHGDGPPRHRKSLARTRACRESAVVEVNCEIADVYGVYVAIGYDGSGAASLRMSMRQPVNLAASLAFWPSRPIASESW